MRSTDHSRSTTALLNKCSDNLCACNWHHNAAYRQHQGVPTWPASPISHKWQTLPCDFTCDYLLSKRCALNGLRLTFQLMISGAFVALQLLLCNNTRQGFLKKKDAGKGCHHRQRCHCQTWQKEWSAPIKSNIQAGSSQDLKGERQAATEQRAYEAPAEAPL